MTFVLLISKIFNFFLSPANWIIILLIWRYYSISIIRKRRLTIASILLFFLFSNELIFTKIALAWQPGIPQINKTYEAGIVVGGFSSFDKNGNGYFNEASDRFIQVTKLYQQGLIKNIIVSGGSLWGNEPAEANFVKQQLILQGIPAVNIISEDKSRNTFENAKFSKRLLDSLQIKPPYLLITSAMHMPRAMGIFKKSGMEVMGYPSHFLVVNRKMDWDDYVLPKLDVLGKWNTLIKEFAGTLIYKAAGKI